MTSARKVQSTILALILVLASCATSTVRDPFAVEGAGWPDPPAEKRIAYVAEFSNAADLGIEPGFWQQIVSAVAGGDDDGMVRPMAVVASDDGATIVVADPDARCVHRYDLRDRRYRCLAISRDQRLVSPVGLAMTAGGRLYVSDSQLGRIYQVGSGEKWLQQVPLEVELAQPTGIRWDEDSALLYVTDTGTQSIKVFDVDGRLVKEFSERGNQPGQLNYPTYLWIDAGRELLVTDSLNFRIQRLSKDGEFIRAFGENGDKHGSLPRPKGVATDSLGHVYVVDALFHALQIFDREGQLLLAIGRRGQGPGEFWLPNGIHVSGDNTIYVADSYNRRVQVFRYVGPDA